MQGSNLRYKLHLRGSKVVLILLMALFVHKSYGQGYAQMNNPNYDDRFIAYGFLIGLHNTAYKLQYSDAFVTNSLDTVHSILPRWSPGFSLGFIVNMNLGEYFDLRTLPKVAFYERALEYNYTDESQQVKLKESTVVEIPIVLKYKSARRKNIRMYTVGGIKPGFKTSGKNDLESGLETLNIKRVNVSAEFGFGFDLYFPLFKFSPELRFSKGLVNVLGDQQNIYSAGVARLRTNTINFYLLFQ